jgi:hypothetical protein
MYPYKIHMLKSNPQYDCFTRWGLGVVVHACNPIYLEVEIRRMVI